MQPTPNDRPTPVVAGRTRIDPRGYVVVQLELPDDDIEAMCLIGEFNGWSTSATPMRRMHGRWQAVVPGGQPLGRACLFIYRRDEAFPRVRRLSLRDSDSFPVSLAAASDAPGRTDSMRTPVGACRWARPADRHAPRKGVVMDGRIDGTPQSGW